MQAELLAAQAKLADLKTQRTAAPKHIELQALPADQPFAQLRPEKKHFMDTIKFDRLSIFAKVRA